MNTPNNKRGQETVQKIDEAFVTLLQEKLPHEVEVSELCELAQINRSTFYSHYNDVEALANSRSAWKCLSCFACIERCPRNVKPGKIIDAARQVLIRQRGQEGLSPNEIPALLDEDTPQQLLMSAFRKYRR